MGTTEPVLAYHFLPDDGLTRGYHSGLPRTKVEPGLTLRHEGAIAICASGLHASRRAIDALGYAPGTVACRVEMRGEIAEQDDKLVARERTVLWMGDARRVIQEWSLWVAEEILAAERTAGREPHPDLGKAIDIARAYLAGQATDAEMSSAAGSAQHAADSARHAAASARHAADSARHAAASARHAADSARHAAASARHAADSAQEAFVGRINTELERRLTEAFAPATA